MTNFLSNFQPESYTETTTDLNGKVLGTRERVSMRLKSGRASEFGYIVSDDHAKKVRGQDKGSAKSKTQKETENAYQIITKKAEAEIEYRISQIHEQLPETWNITLNNFRTAIKKKKAFRKKVQKAIPGVDLSFLNIK